MKEIDTIREALEYYMEIEVSGPGQEALVALEAYDPDAIRRECAEAADICLEKQGFKRGKHSLREFMNTAIMSAGKA